MIMSGVTFGTEPGAFGDPLLADGFRFALSESTVPGIVICAILLIISSFTWTVMVTKFRTVSRARRESEKFLKMFRASKDPLSAYANGANAKEAPLFHVYQSGCQEISYQILGDDEVDQSYLARVQSADRISPSQMNGVQLAMERAAGESVQKLESSMPVLATAVSGAPFLGLLGTVWGVMDTFVGVAAANGGAGLASMAPGVSSALVTTVVALLVAIPAMFGYNYLAQSIKSAVVELDNFSAELCGMMDRYYVDHGQRSFRRVTLPTATANEVPTEVRKETRKKPKKQAADQPALINFEPEKEELELEVLAQP